VAIPIHGGAVRKLCNSDYCRGWWSSDGQFFYLEIKKGNSTAFPGKTLAIPIPAGKSLPDFSALEIDAGGSDAQLPGARVIEHGSVSPGPDPSTYVFTKTDMQRNLFRIPLH
jgi:hypothetical protein